MKVGSSILTCSRAKATTIELQVAHQYKRAQFGITKVPKPHQTLLAGSF